MNDRLEIPGEWWEYMRKDGFFITYFGEIYYGLIVQLQDYPDRIFLVQPSKKRELKKLEPGKERLQEYQRHAREVKDLRAIRPVNLQIPSDNKVKMDLMFRDDQHFKRMFVFGAAASTFCGFGDSKELMHDHPLSAPTGPEVFSEKYNSLLDIHEEIKQTIPAILANGGNIEDFLEKEWEDVMTGYNPSVARRHLSIQFYLRQLLHEVSAAMKKDFWRQNLYSVLLYKCQQFLSRDPNERISFVSFNYDLIFDDILTNTIGRSFTSIGDYTDHHHSNYLLFKPHGSCNWGWRLPSGQLKNGQNLLDHIRTNQLEPWQVYYELLGTPQEMIDVDHWGVEQMNDENFRGRYTIAKSKIEVLTDEDFESSFPALLIPYRDKDELFMPYRQIQILEHAIDSIEELYLIGWKGNERLFNDKLKRARNLKRIIIANPESKEVEAHIRKSLPKGLDPVIDPVSDFEDFVMNEMDEILKTEQN